ncbi:MAG: hypothetical protein K9N29_08000 [Candidatus Marinimicrobia bacterium]|nr:hypothetical protein [Candidatus Neomarinimicrobiota bacterium]
MKWLLKTRIGYTPIVLMLMVLNLGNCTMVFPILAPFSDLPSPTGPYTVATRHATWIDSSRDESFTPEEDYRKIVVQVWFPVSEQTGLDPLPYIDDPSLRLTALARQLRLPRSFINHFRNVHTNTYEIPGTPDLLGTFPVILFSHGLSGMRFQNTSLVEELVSYGYILVAADHSYGANITIFDDGESAEYRAAKRRSLNEDFLNNVDLSQLAIIVGDLRFMLDMLFKSPTDSLLKDLPLDVNHVGVMGHSLGGAAVVNTMAVDQRVKAAMILDGWYAPVPDSVVAAGLDKPIFHLGQKAWRNPDNYARMDELFLHSSGPTFKMLVPGTRHTDFTDMPLFTPFSLLIGYTAAKNQLWLNNLIRVNTTCFFNVYLKDHPVSEVQNQIRSERDVTSYIFVPLLP